MKLKLAFVLLALCALVPSAMPRNFRRNRGYGLWRWRLQRQYQANCKWCFTSSKCFGGSDLENIDSSCTNCIAEKCKGQQALTSSPQNWLDCFSETWQGSCNATCPAWSSTYDNRKAPCMTCLNACNRWNKKVPIPRCNSFGDPCSTCYGESDCYTKEEVGQLFESFCLDYIRISCKSESGTKGYSNACILQAIQSPCSRCDANTTVMVRLSNCGGCFDDCKAEDTCRQSCQNNYPTTLDCPYCNNFCSIQQDKATCQASSSAACGTTCEVCDTCKANCNATSPQNFGFPDNNCGCIESKPRTPFSLFDLIFGYLYRYPTRRPSFSKG